MLIDIQKILLKDKMNNDNYKEKTMNYENTKIYKIMSHLGDKIYIGSTTKKYLSDRMAGHGYQYKLWKKNDKSKISSYELFDEYGFENCFIVLLESCPCKTKDEKNAKEAHYIKSLSCVNKNVPGRTMLQCYHDKRDERIAAHKEWRRINKSKITEQQSIDNVCQCGGTYKRQHKAQHCKTLLHKAFVDSIKPA